MKKTIKKIIVSMIVMAQMVLMFSSATIFAAEEINLDFSVISDTHYFPTRYNGTRSSDYQNQISGDLRLMGEGEALSTGAVDQMLAQEKKPEVLFVTGDLSSEGELEAHKGFATQLKRLEDAGINVYVIPGNHDLYNESAMSFESDKKVQGKSLYTNVDQFKEIYKDFGYDKNDTTISRYQDDNNDSNAIQGGLSYVVRPENGYAYLMIDSEMYTSDVNGYDYNRGTGQGMISDKLKAWILEQIKESNAKGETILAYMHHPLLAHNTTSETEFITDTVKNNEALVKEFADAGLRYAFTGHMHENDIASYSTSIGNTLYDLETGGMVAYGSPIRTIHATKKGITESLDISSESVKEAAMEACLDAPNGNIVHKEKVDVLQYEEQAMYSDEFIKKLIHRYANGYLNQLDDIPAALKNIANLDLYDTLFKALPSLLKNPISADLGGSVGKIDVTYSSSYSETGKFDEGNTDGVHLAPKDGVAAILGKYTIRDADIKTEVQSVIDQIEEKYIRSGELNKRIDDVIEKIGTVELAEGHTLKQLLRAMFEVHNLGADSIEKDGWIQQSIDMLANGSLIKDKVNDVIENDIKKLLNDVLENDTINLKTLFGRNSNWLTAVKAVMGSETPALKTALEKLGVNLNSTLDGLINQYLSDSFFTSVGGLAQNMIHGFVIDDSQDDVVNGKAVTLEYDGELHPNYSIENGMLPNQLTVSLGNTSTKRNFSWYTGTDVHSGEVQYIKASQGITSQNAFDDTNKVTTVKASVNEENKAKLKLNLILVTTYDIVKSNRYKATIDLEEGSDYYYRVGNSDKNLWSEPVLLNQKNESEGFTFINVADSQGATLADYTHYNDVLAKAESQFKNASFITHLGDIVDDGNNENYWSWVLNTPEMQSLPVMPVAGNHEARATNDQLMNAIEAHYDLDLPEQDKSNGVYYSYQYQDATFIVLNTNDLNGNNQLSEEQMKWAEETAKNAQTKWKILLTHKAPYSMGPHKNDSDVLNIREQLNKYTADYGIDFVLSGHDHTYMRSSYLCDGVAQETETTSLVKDGITYKTAVNPTGTVFVIPSTSGVKYYELNEDKNLPAEKYGQPYQSIYSGITIQGDELYYTAYTADGKVYDNFAISKKEKEPDLAQDVIDMIAALPNTITLSDKDAVVAARNAYNALTDEQKVRVTNLTVLEGAEKVIATIEGTSSKETKTVNNKDDFLNALKDGNVGTIEVSGNITIGKDGAIWAPNFSDVYQSVDHDVVIKGVSGDAQLDKIGLMIGNNATLILDNIKLNINHGSTQGNGHLTNLVELNDGTLITQGTTSMLLGGIGKCSDAKGPYGSKWEHGHAISLKGTGKVYINSTGEIESKFEPIFSTDDDRGTEVVVNNGTLKTSDNARSIALGDNSSVTINGGSMTSVEAKDIYMNGGEIGKDNTGRYPLVVRGDAYISAGTIYADTKDGDSKGKVIDLKENGKVYYNSTKIVGLNVVGNDGKIEASMNDVSTSNNKDLSVYVGNLGTSGDGNIYALDNRNLTSIALLAKNEEGKLDTQYSDNELSARLSKTGTNYVYTKYKVTGGALADVITMNSNTEVWAISSLKTINNVAVSAVQLSADTHTLMAGQTLQIQARTLPNTALDNHLTWSVEGNAVTVDEKGLVTVVQTGTAKVIATAPSGVTGEWAISVVENSIKGNDEIAKEVFETEYSLENKDEKYEVRWEIKQQSDNVNGYVDEEGIYHLVRYSYKGETISLTAKLYENDQYTGVSYTKEIVIKENTEIKAVIDGISQLPEEITLNEEESVKTLSTQYNALSSEEKRFVTNAKALTDAINVINSLKEEKALIEEVIQFINDIPNTITLKDEEKIQKAQKAYDQLSDSQKEKVTNSQKLKDAQSTLLVLKDQDKAKTVIDYINAIGTVNSLEDNSKVETARNAYDQLNQTQQALVNNYQTLLDAEEKIKELKGEAALIQEVIDAIKKIPNPLTLDDAQFVKDARKKYDALTDVQKGKVTNKDVLESSEAKLKELEMIANAKKVSDAIDQLSQPITLKDEATVQELLKAYQALSKEEQALVKNYQVLVDASQTISLLKAEDELKLMQKVKASLYTEDSYKLLKNAMATLQKVIQDKDMDQLSSALEDMNKAYENLTKKTNYIVNVDQGSTLDKDLLDQVIENHGKIEITVNDKTNSVILPKGVINKTDTPIQIVIYKDNKIDYVWTVMGEVKEDMNLVITKENTDNFMSQGKQGIILRVMYNGIFPTDTRVRIYVGERYKENDQLRVSYYGGKSLSESKIYSVDKDGYIVMEMEYSSYFIEKVETITVTPDDNNHQTTKPIDPTDSTNSPEGNSTPENINKPTNTSDITSIQLIITMMVLSTMMLGVLRKKKDNE